MRLKLAIAVGALSAVLFAAGAARAEGVELLPNGMLSPSSQELTPADKFKKAAPWRIGVSWPGVGNTWLVQTINEMKYEAALHKEISEFIFTDADWKTTKQVADIEDLLAKKVDALIIAPIAGPVVADQVAKAKAQGIPVVIFETGRVNTAGDTQISAGGEVFGQQGGEFIKKILNGKGSIWAFRGIAGVDEEQARYDGFRKGIEGSDIKISAEEFGDWNYAKAKGLWDPESKELAYPEVPVASVKEVLGLTAATRTLLPKIVCPTMIIQSREDHVVPPANVNVIAAGVSSDQIEILRLNNSYHVATIDHDKALIASEIIGFIRRHA